jgi:hypothetical protein
MVTVFAFQLPLVALYLDTTGAKPLPEVPTLIQTDPVGRGAD